MEKIMNKQIKLKIKLNKQMNHKVNHNKFRKYLFHNLNKLLRINSKVFLVHIKK